MARVMVTFNLCKLARNPIEPCTALALTQVTMMQSFCRPWKASTVSTSAGLFIKGVSLLKHLNSEIHVHRQYLKLFIGCRVVVAHTFDPSTWEAKADKKGKEKEMKIKKNYQLNATPT